MLRLPKQIYRFVVTNELRTVELLRQAQHDAFMDEPFVSVFWPLLRAIRAVARLRRVTTMPQQLCCVRPPELG
ncbi:hypothetical protein [Hymenobacter yonginensis]|uniref:Uncharacterized protein n=1 Tax=Hymenobacter yonginensis TaxID=748197 RepID=A0ABY7PLC1_9BACT|nr:hypothetical protein [Hymenobacter yonginensis]WBO83974.1 hypothetical protein O9Z63_16540 [Hymenobacter yonginensis]